MGRKKVHYYLKNRFINKKDINETKIKFSKKIFFFFFGLRELPNGLINQKNTPQISTFKSKYFSQLLSDLSQIKGAGRY